MPRVHPKNFTSPLICIQQRERKRESTKHRGKFGAGFPSFPGLGWRGVAQDIRQIPLKVRPYSCTSRKSAPPHHPLGLEIMYRSRVPHYYCTVLIAPSKSAPRPTPVCTYLNSLLQNWERCSVGKPSRFFGFDSTHNDHFHNISNGVGSSPLYHMSV